MSSREEVAPDTLGVDLTEDGVAVTYADGRTVFYHGVPRRVESPFDTPPGKEVHVLVTDETETQGVLTYVNERSTRADILEDTGVGRRLLADGATAELFPGVTATATGHRLELEIEFPLVDGRVFVFAEDDFGEQSYEIVPETE